MWFIKSNIYFCKVKNSVYGEINEGGFSNPQPWAIIAYIVQFKINIKYPIILLKLFL